MVSLFLIVGLTFTVVSVGGSGIALAVTTSQFVVIGASSGAGVYSTHLTLFNLSHTVP